MKEIKACVHRSRAADVIVAALASSARTGQSAAGWITVSDVSRVVPIH